MKTQSHYAVITARHPSGNLDQTAIGIIVFTAEGNLHQFKLAPLDRAKARGDFPQDDPGDWLPEFIGSIASLDHLQTLHQSTTQAMSSIQIGNPHATLLAPEPALNLIYQRLIIEDQDGTFTPHPGSELHTALHPKVQDAANTIDAEIFSTELSTPERLRLQYYTQRWNRALKMP